jgi:hypothetical protein
MEENYEYLVFLVMHSNRYIRKLIKMYQNSAAEAEKLEKEELSQKPDNWEECKEYFKSWLRYHLLFDEEVNRLVSHTARNAPILLRPHLLNLLHKKLDEA